MTTHNPQTRGAVRSSVAWGGIGAMLAVFLLGSSATLAAPAPANSVIGNQASASYIDPNGNAQVSTSNLVQTTVQQVGSFTLDGQSVASPVVQVNNKSGAAGATIYAPHVLVNTGNGADSFNISVNGSTKFSKVEIYTDSNLDGLPDSATPLCSITNPIASTTCTVPSAQTVAGSNGQFGFVVAYTIPATATATGAYDIGNVTVAPITASLSLYGATNQSVVVKDNVNLVNVAAFNVSKTIALPSTGINPPSGSWPTAVNNGKRSPASASCPTTWAGVGTAPASCVYTTYTITYSNTGGASGRFNMQDVIGTGATAGLTYVTGSAVWSNKSGVALAETAGNAANTGSGIDMAWTSGTNTLVFVDNALPVNTTRSLTFVVLVNANATVGTTSTSNDVKYNPSDAAGATAAAPVAVTSANSNQAPFTVLGSYSIAVGTSSSATSADAKDATAGIPGTGGTDTQTVATIAAGKPAVYTHKVYNLGNDTDSVNISISSNTFPSGTVFRFYKPDGTTELSDSNNDGKVDTGPIAAGASVNIIVKATVPAATPANATANYSLTVLGTSGSDTAQTDASADKLTAVTGPFIDLTNTASGLGGGGANDDLGTGPSASPTVTKTNVAAGSWTAFSLFIKNNDSVSNTFALSASATTTFPGTLPAGWTVKFASGNVAATSCSAAGAITTIAAATGAQSQVTACVFVPATQATINQAVYFQAKATVAASDGTFPADVIYDQVNTTAAALTYSATLTPNGNGTVLAGGSAVYGHILTATGTGSCQASTMTVSLPAADVTAGWTTAVYLDVNGNGVLDAGDTLITSGALPAVAPGTPVYLLVKVFAPAGASAGKTSVVTTSLTFPAGTDNCGTPAATDTSTVVLGQIQVVATQAKNASCNAAGITTAIGNLAGTVVAAKPGECVVYRITATNTGTSTVTNLNVSNAVPSYTKVSATQPTTTCSSTNVTPAVSNPTFATTATSVSCGGSNSVAAGGTITLTFQVQLDS